MREFAPATNLANLLRAAVSGNFPQLAEQLRVLRADHLLATMPLDLFLDFDALLEALQAGRLDVADQLLEDAASECQSDYESSRTSEKFAGSTLPPVVSDSQGQDVDEAPGPPSTSPSYGAGAKISLPGDNGVLREMPPGEDY
jgi:hypothetical protein